jgi:hypothetical protein
MFCFDKYLFSDLEVRSWSVATVSGDLVLFLRSGYGVSEILMEFIKVGDEVVVRNGYFRWTYQGIGAEVLEGKKQGLRSGERDKGRFIDVRTAAVTQRQLLEQKEGRVLEAEVLDTHKESSQDDSRSSNESEDMEALSLNDDGKSLRSHIENGIDLMHIA